MCYYTGWRAYSSVSGVIDAAVVKVHMIVDAVGEGTVAWIRDVGYMTRALTSFLFLAALMWGLKASAGKRFNYIWPTPYAHACREDEQGSATGPAAGIRARSQAAREAFRQKLRGTPIAQTRVPSPQEDATSYLGPGMVTPQNLPAGTKN